MKARGLRADDLIAQFPSSHVSNLLGKLGLRDRVQAVIYAYETRLIAPADH